MANRDLFRNIDAYDSQRREANGRGDKTPWQVFVQRMLAQAVVALLLFGGIVYLYDQESALGEGVRYIVALASADEQQIMAVSSFADIWQDLVHKAESLDGAEQQPVPAEQTEPDKLAAEYQPDENYLQTAAADDEGNLVMILPASGLMQSAFGDIDEQGLKVEGLKIFCQNQQAIKAAAIGEVVEATPGEKIVLRHRDGVESCYLGAVQPAVAVGETMRQGQILGQIEESTLFFQVLRDGQPLDPFLFVKGPE